MKNKFLIKSTLLLSTLVLSVSSAMAAPVSPYSASVFADVFDNETNSFNQPVSVYGNKSPYTRSFASANGYELGARSSISVREQKPFPPNEPQPDELFFSLYTEASSSFNQQFVVLSNEGTASLRFAWDGNLFSDGVYSAGYNFSLTVGKERFRDGNSIGGNGGGGSQEVSLFNNVSLDLSRFEIGDIFNVSAYLSTYAGNLQDEDHMLALNGPILPMAGFAWADFSNTATLNFTGGIQAITPAAVPVPAAVWLFGSALMGLVGIRRKKAMS